MSDFPIAQWGALETNATFTQPTESTMRLTQFERKIRRRNIIEYTAGLLVIAVFGWVAWLSANAGEYLVTASWLTLIAGNIVVMVNLRRLASNLVRSPETDCHSHLRAQMVHQREALQSVAKWYVGPLVPGLLLAIVAMAIMTAETAGWLAAMVGLFIPALFVGAILAGVIWLNRRAARTLSDKIAEMDRLVSA
ncbi:hypothetical protein [Pontixanthobacter sp. CEM42]|uniref:hypothetical protein n=1 Tax=Pontixanthobacter sp. CEM42 TaxID=2792077 RepID=UPI001ADFC0D0|nr:hypothetical protein [Pontixanthobacter sp. CEM42]